MNELEIKKKLIIISILVLGVITFGTVGYITIENMDILNALYMTVITVATVGFKEVKDLSKAGKIFTILLIFSGFGVFAYAMTIGAKILIEGEIREVFKKRKMKKEIDALKNHYIICGYGRMGKILSKEFKANKVNFVVIEKFEENVKDEEGILYLIGDATKDEILKEAGIERAKGIISLLPSDAENLYVVISARFLNPKIYIVARATDEEAKNKLKMAGANKAICPYHIGGLRIAHTVLRPNVVDFLEFATRSEFTEIQIEEISISKNSKLVGKTLKDAQIGREFGIIVIGIKRADGKIEFNPSADTVIEVDDILIVIGKAQNLFEFSQVAEGKENI
ncbi:MAG: potassium channel protein [Thermodesulfobacterium geofontis]|uniref:Potassium channel protein n=1 Tax=Thermodesulfobacterium geofontis TaxID=1295609 RepID=A0A2N7PNS3_9BACT|nr:MAG: potassium channel protein [Thermodesulfobacterium geofontis]